MIIIEIIIYDSLKIEIKKFRIVLKKEKYLSNYILYKLIVYII